MKLQCVEKTSVFSQDHFWVVSQVLTYCIAVTYEGYKQVLLVRVPGTQYIILKKYEPVQYLLD